jgi:hypothetical protein
MALPGAQNSITQALLTWEEVRVAPHRFGGVEYRLGSRELGHIHGDHMVDIPFPRKVRDEVVASGQASPHHLLPETGWVSLYLRQPGDVDIAIDLLQRSYQIALTQRQLRSGKP